MKATTVSQKAALERMVMFGACIQFDSDDGNFWLIVALPWSLMLIVNPFVVRSLIQGKYIETTENGQTTFYLTDKGLTEARE